MNINKTIRVELRYARRADTIIRDLNNNTCVQTYSDIYKFSNRDDLNEVIDVLESNGIEFEIN